VRVAWAESEAVLEEDAGVHAGEHGGVAARSHRKVSEVEIAGEDFVGG